MGLRRDKALWILVTATVVMAGGGALLAQETSSLAATEAAEFLGDWTLNLEIQGNAVEMTLRLKDVGGKVAASLESARSPEPQLITEISKTDEGLRLEWERDFGGQTGTLGLDLQLADSGLTGVFGDTGGFFSADVEGVRASGSSASQADTTASADSSSTDSDSDSSDNRRRRRRGGATARLTLSGHKLEIGYADLKTSSEDYGKLAKVADGEVFKFVGGRATKLKTEVSLKFGDVIVKKENVAENYPGVYSLWLKKVGDTWHLVFNDHADIWGTQHLAEADAAEIPIDMTDSESEEESFKIELLEVGDGGLLRLAWGPHQWMAPFELAE